MIFNDEQAKLATTGISSQGDPNRCINCGASVIYCKRQCKVWTRPELIKTIDWSFLNDSEATFAKENLSDKELEKLLKDQQHAETCNSIQCHHDLWSLPPCKYGHKDCRCLGCMHK